MPQFSFDIVSDYDKAEMNNVFEQAIREIGNRYDFKNTPAAIEWLNSDKSGFKITGNSDYQIDAILDVIRKKIATRNLDQKILDISSQPTYSNLKVTKEIIMKHGLNHDKAKKITKFIQNTNTKIKTSIQGDTVRVIGSNKDDLQTIIQLLKQQDFDFPLSFINYR